MAHGDFLTLASIPLRCLRSGARERKVATLGKRRRGQMGNMLSSERTPKREFSVPVLFDDAAAAAACLVAISVTGSPGVPKKVSATSVADGITRGATLDVWAVMGDLEPEQFGGTDEIPEGVYWTTVITFEQD